MVGVVGEWPLWLRCKPFVYWGWPVFCIYDEGGIIGDDWSNFGGYWRIYAYDLGGVVGIGSWGAVAEGASL